jgi:hypothetical protein
MTGYQRTIVIAPVLDSLLNPIATLRSITITMQYSTSQTKLPKTYILNSYISEFQ